jgi:hypothetical protein
MQNAKQAMQNAKCGDLLVLHFALLVLHFAFVFHYLAFGVAAPFC